MLRLREEKGYVKIMFTCEICGEEFPISECTPFSIETDLMMLCKKCDQLYRKGVKTDNPSNN